jgi:hypothetical protein
MAATAGKDGSIVDTIVRTGLKEYSESPWKITMPDVLPVRT